MAARTAASGTQAVDRAAPLIRLVVRADEPLTFTELVDEAGLARSTTSRLLAALERTGLLERDPDGGYVAGRAVLRCTPRGTTRGRSWPGSPARRWSCRRARPARPSTSASPAATASCRSRRSSRRTCSAPATGSRSTCPPTARRWARCSTPSASLPAARRAARAAHRRTIADRARSSSASSRASAAAATRHRRRAGGRPDRHRRARRGPTARSSPPRRLRTTARLAGTARRRSGLLLIEQADGSAGLLPAAAPARRTSKRHPKEGAA